MAKPKPKNPRVLVVTMLTAGKDYVAGDMLHALHALTAPEGWAVSYLVVIGGILTAEGEAELGQWLDSVGPPHVTLLRTPAITQYEGHPYWRSLVAGELRDRAVAHFAADPPDWVFWVDGDTVPDPDTLERLLAAGKPVVSALVLGRTQGYLVCGMERHDPATGFEAGSDIELKPGLNPVGWVGMGCILVRGDVAVQIRFRPYLDGTDPRYPVYIGEDSFHALEAARLAGEPVLVDADVCPWHVDSNGLALRAQWLEGLLTRGVRTFGKLAQRPYLIPRVTGRNHRLGEMVSGQPLYADATGREFTLEEMRELAGSSQLLDLIEPEELPD